MIRLIVKTDDAAMAANVGGSVLTTFRTFEIDHPQIEALLRSGGRNDNQSFCHSQLVGAEIVGERA